MKKLGNFIMWCIIIGIIILLCYMGKDYNNGIQTNSTSNITSNKVTNTGKVNNTVNKNTTNNTNTANNTNTSNNTEGKNEVKENNVNNNTTENTTSNNTVNNTQDGNKVNEEVKLTDEQKAVDLAKNYFGITDGVYYKVEQTQGNGIYIVSVRDSETTKAIEWYTINVNNGEVQ